jgi:excisionase family DNA binding protein
MTTDVTPETVTQLTELHIEVKAAPQDPPTRAVYTIQQAADQLGTSRAHIYRLINGGFLPTVDISMPGSVLSKTRILPEDLYAYVKSLRES